MFYMYITVVNFEKKRKVAYFSIPSGRQLILSSIAQLLSYLHNSSHATVSHSGFSDDVCTNKRST